MALFDFRRSKGESRDAAPRDAAGCKAWLASLQRPESPETLGSVTAYASQLNAIGVSAAQQLAVLDQIRAFVFEVLRARVDFGEFRSLPLNLGEVAPVFALRDCVAVLCKAHEALIGATNDADFDRKALHRALDLHAHLVCLFLAMRMVVPTDLWDVLCRYGQRVRELDAQDVVQPDALNAILGETCREAFTTPMLLALADPAALTQVEFLVVRALARRYAARVSFRIDLANSPGLQAQARPQVPPGPVLKLAGHEVRLDTQRVQPSISARVAALDEGKTAVQIGLGERISSTSSRALLQHLVRLWGPINVANIDAPEHQWRKPMAEFTLAMIGFAVKTETADRRPGGRAYAYDQGRYDGLTRSHEDLERAKLAELLAQAETWQLNGEVSSTLLCTRRHSRPRISLNQLVTLKPGGKGGPTPLLLGQINGLQQGGADQTSASARDQGSSVHHVRVRLLDGLPVRIKASIDGEELESAFVLIPVTPGASPDLSTPTLWDRFRAAPQGYTVVLPLRSNRGGVLRAAAGGSVINLVLGDSVQRGVDFEQFVIAPA